MFCTNLSNEHILFRNRAEAEAFMAGMVESAEAGETFEIKMNPKGNGRCIVEKFFNGVSEGYC